MPSDPKFSTLDPFTGLEVPILEGRLVTDISVGTTATDVAHKLGRPYRGWWVVDNDTAATIRRDASSTADNAVFLTLIASSAATVSLWVF
jgi:hypothetical protein